MKAGHLLQLKEPENNVINEAISFRINTLRDLTRELLDEVEDMEAAKDIDISSGINIYEEVRSFESALIRRALRLTGGNQKKAAGLLGLLPTTLNDKIKRYQISTH